LILGEAGRRHDDEITRALTQRSTSLRRTVRLLHLRMLAIQQLRELPALVVADEQHFRSPGAVAGVFAFAVHLLSIVTQRTFSIHPDDGVDGMPFLRSSMSP
jgi:hypothetical protein